MDIQNFETAYLNAGGKASELEKEDGEYVSSKSQMGWEMWQAATAQAVPEGFVLVSMDRLANAVDGVEVLFEEDPTLALGELLPIQQELNAMIKAQEQSHDSN